MASTVADSCEVWNAEVRDPAGCVGAFGDCEHLRELCGPGTRLEAGQLCWLTDRTVFYGNFAKLHPYFKRCASGSERERHCARILRKFRENTVAPYATLPYGSRL